MLYIKYLKTILILILAFILSIGFLSIFAQGNNDEIKLEKPIEVKFFSLKDHSGKDHNLGEFTGFITKPNIALFIPFTLSDKLLDKKIEIANGLSELSNKMNISIVLSATGKTSSREIRELIKSRGILPIVLLDTNSNLYKNITNDETYPADAIFIMGIDKNINYLYPITTKSKIENITKNITNRYNQLIKVELKKESINKNTFDLVVMTNPIGTFSVCNCPTQPYGGLSRYAYILDEYRRMYKEPPVAILSGNILSDKSKPDYHNYFYKGCSSLELSAMIPAINDFIESYSYIDEVMKKTKLPYTAANINANYLQLASYNIIKTNGIKIGVIGLVPVELLSKYSSLPKDLLINDYDKAVKEVLKKLEKETDINILSIHAKNYKDIKKLVAFNPKINIVINSNSENLSFSPSAINSYDVPVIELGNKGEFAITVRMEITKGKAKATDVKYSRLDQNIIEHGAILKYLYEYQDNFGM